jgi:hypothetical protein
MTQLGGIEGTGTASGRLLNRHPSFFGLFLPIYSFCLRVFIFGPAHRTAATAVFSGEQLP